MEINLEFSSKPNTIWSTAFLYLNVFEEISGLVISPPVPLGALEASCVLVHVFLADMSAV